MEAFKEKYKQLCKKFQVSEQDIVLDSVKETGSGLLLDFSTCSLPYNTCKVLSKILCEDCNITSLCFCDCLLSHEAVMIIMDGLTKNSSVKFLHLKGNGMNASHSEDIGRFLNINSTIHHLSLEWNGLGKVPSKFEALCRGLASNTSLKILDLRSNQIDNEGATTLANSLQRNHCLQQIDLRWNMIGDAGAQALVDVLQQNNNTVIKMEIAGNVAVSSEVISAIESAVSKNCTLQLIQEEHIMRTKELADEIKSISMEKAKEISALVKSAAVEEKKYKASLEQIKELEELLAERKTEFNSVLDQFVDLQNKLREAEERNKEINDVVTSLKKENARLKEQQQELIIKNKKETADAEKERNSIISQLEQEKMHLQLELDCSLRKNSMQEEKVSRLQATNVMFEKRIKMVELSHNEEIEDLKQKNKESLTEIESLKKDELQKMRNEVEEINRVMKENLAQSENQITLLEKENIQLNAKILDQKFSIDEMLQQQRQQIQSEIGQQCEHLSDKLRTLQEECNHHNKTIIDQKSCISDLQLIKSQLQNEKEGLLRTIKQLKQQIVCKDEEIKALTDKAQFEQEQHLQNLQTEKENQVHLHTKINQLETTLRDIKQQHYTQLSSKENEITEVKSMLKQAKVEISLLKENEAHRASVLVKAFQSYLSGVPKQLDPSLCISDSVQKDD